MELPFDLRIGDRVALLTLDRPKTLNSLTFAVYRELVRFFQGASHDESFDVIVVTGTGRGFCSGGDVHEIIGELFSRDMKGMIEFTRMTGDLVKAIRLVDKPVLAAVNGLAAGAGAVIALACDLRVMAESASFRFLFTHVGLTGADMGAGYLLPKVVGLSKASEMLLLGEKVTSTDAERFGLANKVVPHDDLLAEANRWAQELAQNAPLAVAAAKRSMRLGLESSFDANSYHVMAELLQLFHSKDFAEGLSSFIEKREAKYEGR